MPACRFILVLLLCGVAAVPLKGQPPGDTLTDYIARARQAAAALPPEQQSKLLALMSRSCVRHARREADDCLAQAATAASKLNARQAGERLCLLAEVYAEAGQADRATQTANAIESFSRRAKALAAVADAQRRIMDLEAMERSFDQAKRAAGAADQPADRVEALLAVARIQQAGGQRDQAAATVKLAFQEALNIEEEPRRLALLEAVALAWARCDQLDLARSAARWMGVPHGMKPDEIRSVLPRFHLARLLPQFALIQFRDGEIAQAAETLRQAEDAAAGITYDDDQAGLNRCDLLCRLAQASLQTGDREFALRVLGQARDLASGVRLAWHRRQIARLLGRAGDDQAALAIADEIVSPASTGDSDARREQALAYADLADEQFRARRPQAGLRSAERARQAARACPGPTACDALTLLGFVLLDADGLLEARQTFDQATRHLPAVPSKSREHLAMRLAEGLARYGDLPAARELIERHVDAQRRYEARAVLWPVQVEKLKPLAQKGQAAPVRRLADEMLQDGADPLMLASAMLEAGNLDLAIHYFDRALQSPQALGPKAHGRPSAGPTAKDSPAPKARGTLSVGFVRTEDSPTASQSRPAEDRTNPCENLAEFARRLGAALSAAGRHDDLAAFAEQVSQPELRAWLFLGAVEGRGL